MAISTVNIGSAPNDGTGDPLRTAFNKLNTNFLNITADGGDEITVLNPVTSTETTLNEALEDINDNVGAAPDLESVLTEGDEAISDDGLKKIQIDRESSSVKIYTRPTTGDAWVLKGEYAYNSATITDGTDTNNVSANGVSVSDGVDFCDVSKTQLQLTDFSQTTTLTKDGLVVSDGTSETLLTKEQFSVSDGIDTTSLYPAKITNNSVDYPLPTGASSPIATLADITGGGGYTVVSSNTNASNDTNYTVVANATFTDPSPTEGKGYVVYVRNGTATIGGTGYAVGSLVFRVFHSGGWNSVNFGLKENTITAGTTGQYYRGDKTFQTLNVAAVSGLQTALDLRVITLLNDNVTTSAVTGTTANTIIKSYLIPANTLAIGDTLDFKTVVSKTGTNGTGTFRVYINTSNSLSGASPLGIMSFAASTLYYSLDRTYTLKSDNTLQCYNVATPNVTDESNVTGAISNVAFDRTVDNYLIIAIQPNNGSDSFVQTLCYLMQMKAKTSI